VDDLKTPLRGIKTLADWICQDYKDALDDQGKERLNLLLSRTDRMHNLINCILRYSRGGRMVDEIGPVDTNEIVHEVIDLLAPPENVTIVVSPCLPVVQAKRTKTVQVFQDLLSDAIKYMDRPQGRIEVGAVKEGELWKFSVSDNGPGIEEKYFDKVFQIFQTLSPRDEYYSTGVGLSLVKRVVEAYDGDIWLESQVGDGCTFLFTLPEARSPKGVPNAKLQTSPSC
jgi:light-regulated signal transduction histidine kinase (bacteriophytochrome)